MYGSTIEVRIGMNGDIIGLFSGWRPYYGIEIVERINSPTQQDDKHEHNASISKNPVYILESTGEPQLFLAPYYIGSSGHEISIFPASHYSLSVKILEEIIDQTGALRLTAVIIGADSMKAKGFDMEKRIQYSWGSYRLDSHALEFTDIGTSSTIAIEKGIHNVILQVEDIQTHAIAHIQQIVYAGIPANRTERMTL